MHNLSVADTVFCKGDLMGSEGGAHSGVQGKASGGGSAGEALKTQHFLSDKRFCA